MRVYCACTRMAPELSSSLFFLLLTTIRILVIIITVFSSFFFRSSKGKKFLISYSCKCQHYFRCLLNFVHQLSPPTPHLPTVIHFDLSLQCFLPNTHFTIAVTSSCGTMLNAMASNMYVNAQRRRGRRSKLQPIYQH